MSLPPELTRVLPASLDVLRYMGQSQLESADAETLAEGTRLSERGILKAIRGLVTGGYLTADQNYIYYLTRKGHQAIGDLAAYDAERAAQGGQSSRAQFAQAELVAVAPAAFDAQKPNMLQVGFGNMSGLQGAAQVILRFSSVGGAVNKQEVTFTLQPTQAASPVALEVTPDSQHQAVRVRVEGIQLLDSDDVHPAGGMFFDIPVGTGGGHLQAWYGTLTLQA